jgi:Tol biopolymer transport system component
MKRAFLGLVGVAVCGLVGTGLGQDITRASVDSAGNEGDGNSGAAVVSDDGRWTAFESDARNLVVGDIGGLQDVFLHNRTTGVTVRVSEVGGVGGDGDSGRPAISADGSTVVFESEARNLVVGDMNGVSDIFSYDVATGVVQRVSLDNLGVEGDGLSREPSVSRDGRFVAFYSEARNLHASDHNTYRDVFVRYMGSSPPMNYLASLGMGGTSGNGNSGFYTALALSGDGQTVAFISHASDLVPLDTNGMADIFTANITTGIVRRISVTTAGIEANSSCRSCDISGDGLRVAFDSAATNLVTGDTNSAPDVFLRDTVAGTTERVSVAADGTEGNSYSRYPAVSGDGSTVAFESAATNLGGLDANSANDVYAVELATGQITRLSQDLNGIGGNGTSTHPSMGLDQTVAVFTSDATNLVAADTNSVADVFSWSASGGCGGQAPSNYCISAPNSAGAGAVMDWAGSTVVSNNNLVLVSAGSIPNQFGIFYYGPNQVLFTFGNGYRCVGGSVYRLPPLQADGAGVAMYPLDNTNPPQASGQITGGSTWNFQFWYRDPGVGASFNLSDALEVYFCP